MELLGDTVIILASQVITNDSLWSEQIMFVNHLNISWQVVFFLVGWIFFVKMLFRDYELHHNLVQLIFCVNFRYLSWLDITLITTKKLFSLSCTMFELIIFEIISFLDKNSRWIGSTPYRLILCDILFRYFHWYFAIYFMLFMVIGESFIQLTSPCMLSYSFQSLPRSTSSTSSCPQVTWSQWVWGSPWPWSPGAPTSTSSGSSVTLSPSSLPSTASCL